MLTTLLMLLCAAGRKCQYQRQAGHPQRRPSLRPRRRVQHHLPGALLERLLPRRLLVSLQAVQQKPPDQRSNPELAVRR